MSDILAIADPRIISRRFFSSAQKVVKALVNKKVMVIRLPAQSP